MQSGSRFARERIRDARRAFIRRHRWPLALVVLLIFGFAATAAGIVVPITNHFAIATDRVIAFTAGVAVAAAAAALHHFLGMDGARSYREGAEAENWTATELKRLSRQGWMLFNDVEFFDSNVDHVLIGPQGAIAVETKRRSSEWHLSSEGIIDMTVSSQPQPVTRPIAAARRHAARLQSLLRAVGVVTEVTPVLVLWGTRLNGAPHVTVDGVEVCVGGRAAEWRPVLVGRPLSDAEVRQAAAAIRDRKKGREVGPVPHRVSEQYVTRPAGDSGSVGHPRMVEPARVG